MMVSQHLFDLLLFGLLAVTLASCQPITSPSVLGGLSKEGSEQYSKLSLRQQETAVAELQALSINLLDAKSLRFSPKGKVCHLPAVYSFFHASLKLACTNKLFSSILLDLHRGRA